jgi:hypothetical protein
MQEKVAARKWLILRLIEGLGQISATVRCLVLQGCRQVIDIAWCDVHRELVRQKWSAIAAHGIAANLDE